MGRGFQMSAMMSVFPNDRVYLKHDLMVEIMRLEMALEEARARGAANQQRETIVSLEKRRSMLNDALSRLTA